MKIYIEKDSAGNKLYPSCFLIQKPGQKVSYYQIFNDEKASKNVTHILCNQQDEKKCQMCHALGLSCKTKFDTYARMFTHLARNANGKPIAVVVWHEDELKNYEVVQRFDMKNCYPDGVEINDEGAVPRDEKTDERSETSEFHPEQHKPNRSGSERSAGVAVPVSPSDLQLVRISRTELSDDLKIFSDIEINFHGMPDGLQSDFPNYCPSLYLQPKHLDNHRDLVRFLQAKSFDQYGILLFHLPNEFTDYSNSTFNQFSKKLGKFQVLSQSVQWRSNGCHLVIGEIEGENKNGQWKKKLFDLNEFRSQTGPTERTRRQSREECLEFLRNRPLGKPLGLYGTDINQDITNGKLRKIIGSLAEVRPPVPGISTPYTYSGAFLNTFNLHTEDLDLHSASFHVAGEPKFWWGISGTRKAQVVDFLKAAYANEFTTCENAFKHKSFFVEPQELRNAGIPVFEADQLPDTAVFTFPGAFHEGLNSGQSLAVAINFDSESWFKKDLKPAAKEICTCGQLKHQVTENTLKSVIDSWKNRMESGEPHRKCSRT